MPALREQPGRDVPGHNPTHIVEGREQRIHKLPPSEDRAKLRSLTYAGVAAAMADQWGAFLEGRGRQAFTPQSLF